MPPEEDDGDGPEPEDDEVDEENLTPRTRVLLAKANAKYMEALGLSDGKEDGKDGKEEAKARDDESDGEDNDVDAMIRRHERQEKLRREAEAEAERLSKTVVARVPLPRGEKEHPLDPTPIRVRRKKGKRGEPAAGAGVGAGEAHGAAAGTVTGDSVMRRGVLGAAVASKTQPPAIVLRGWRSSESGSDGEL